MASVKDRVFAGFGAILFLITSCALTIVVVVSIIQQNNANKPKPACSTSPAANKENVVNKGQKLEGTNLANFKAGCTISKLETIDTVVGSGQTVAGSDTVTVDYTGAVVATGVIFQSSKDTGKPVTFPLSGVIPGWTQGVPGMKVGGTRRLLIPAALAYGANPPQGSGIPANANLVFDITLHAITK
jgi:FKBP-type peptidyl-prolyl cis-trans isomerase